ncbi:DUF58 domain-containing protein [Gryllotalpicola sp.]|uniref:DUF58 domain-containing protein n=1 Tax=Gryllotalpicola sp. TaxID=1932787 RepID=UPI0026377A48|nr:DUF58 domain-containing protein [Gryllotalpicola sp.]
MSTDLTAGLRAAAHAVTPIGWFAVGAAVVLLPLGLALGWAEFAGAGFLALALLALTAPFLLGGGAYRIEVELPADRVVAGTQVDAVLRVANASRRLELPGRIELPLGAGLVELWVPLLRPHRSHAVSVPVPALRRGVVDVGPVRAVRGDPLGLLRRELAWAGVQRLFVHPVTAVVPSTTTGFVHDLEGAATREVVVDDLAFHSVRPYAAGDTLRSIHWKSTAKTGSLMVRQFEESRRSRLGVVLALREDEFGDGDGFETAVSAAGSLGLRAIRDGRDLAVIAPGARRGIRELSVVSGRALLDELSLVERGADAVAVESACALAGRAVPDLSIAFAVVGSGVGVRRLRALQLRFPRGVQLVVVVCDPDAAPGLRVLGGTPVFTVALLDDLPPLLAKAAAR